VAQELQIGGTSTRTGKADLQFGNAVNTGSIARK
jgi:hypothetical protein